MNYIRITKKNIDKEHICCAMSGKQSVAKKEWLKQRFDDGLVFYRSEERGKCFIEYIPAENAWVPIEADGYLYINCLWVSGSLKGHGYSNDLLEACIRDAKAQGKKGICILCAEGRKREFLADPKFLTYKGFRVADISDCGINLMYLPNHYGEKIRVFGTEIPFSVRAAETSGRGKSIFAHDKNGKVAAAYRSLTKEVLELERKTERFRDDAAR